jgi:3-hydroxyacyl-[acyl-carrier-protein] dehydratase
MRFFLVDRVDELKRGQKIQGVKGISLSEDIFQEHFPAYPVFPGTLLVEALAQLGGFLIEASLNTIGQKPQRAVLCQIDKAQFHEPVWPGDSLGLECQWETHIASAVRLSGKIQREGKVIVKAGLTFTLKEVDSEQLHQNRRELYRIWTRHLQLDFPIL